MNRNLVVGLLVAAVFLGTSALMGIQPCKAVEEHHEPGAKATAPGASESTGMMKGPATGGGPGMMGMMGQPEEEDDQGMTGMTGMMDMMDDDMMRMMMSHMMGGPGGMGKMMGQMGSLRRGHRRGMAPMARVLDNLNLTPEQWDQVRGLARKRLEKMVDLWAQRMKLKIELAGLRWDKEIDPQKVKDLFVKKGEVKAEMFLSNLEYWRELKKILTPDQLEKLEALKGSDLPL
ncbi:MAG: hypothetical protein HY788_11030 [Deltaproteobacteria bacterium]|nr:hypothetical protein [Deltaproteobacteria bacterium]